MLNKLFPCSAGRIFAVMCYFVTRINNNIIKLISLFILSHRLVLFVDINECLNVVAPCAANQLCVNFIGGYLCQDANPNGLLKADSPSLEQASALSKYTVLIQEFNF